MCMSAIKLESCESRMAIDNRLVQEDYVGARFCKVSVSFAWAQPFALGGGIEDGVGGGGGWDVCFCTRAC